MPLNVYDFDGTIYKGDSTADFYKFCVKRHPLALIALPGAGIYFFAYKLGLCSKTRFKEVFYRFLRHIPDAESALSAFWVAHEGGIQDWYLQKKRQTDIIISASPEFLLEPVCKKLGVTLIASRVDRRTGETQGENCRGAEKVKRLNEAAPGCEIEEFYSDDLSDAPLAELAKSAFIVKGGSIVPWSNK